MCNPERFYNSAGVPSHPAFCQIHTHSARCDLSSPFLFSPAKAGGRGHKISDYFEVSSAAKGAHLALYLKCHCSLHKKDSNDETDCTELKAASQSCSPCHAAYLPWAEGSECPLPSCLNWSADIFTKSPEKRSSTIGNITIRFILTRPGIRLWTWRPKKIRPFATLNFEFSWLLLLWQRSQIWGLCDG